MKDEEDYSGWEVVDKPVDDYSDWEVIDKMHKDFQGKDEFLPAQGIGPENSAPQQPQHSTWYDAAQGFRHGIEKYTHGALAPLMNYLAPEAFAAYRRERLGEYEGAKERSPTATSVGNIAGEIGAGIPVAAATGGIGSGLLGGAASGAVTGGLSQFIAHPEEDQTRLSNALKGTIFGAAGGGLLGGLQAAPGAVRALSNKGGAEGLRYFLLGKNSNVAGAEKLYQGIEKQLESAGKSEALDIPAKIQWDEISKHVPKASQKNLPGLNDIKQLLEKGDYNDLNKAQSMLSAWKRELAKRAHLGADNTAALNALQDAEKRIHGSLFKRFMETDPNLALDYQKANELYAKGMGQNEVARAVIGEVSPMAKVLGTFQIFSKLLKGK